MMAGRKIILQSRKAGTVSWRTRNAYRADNAAVAGKPERLLALRELAESHMRQWAQAEPGTEFRVYEGRA